jgi:hypothetical protein
MKKAPIKAVQELMGHSTVTMTERYAHLSPDVRKDAVRLLDRPMPLAHAHMALTSQVDFGLGAGVRALNRKLYTPISTLNRW